MAVNLTTLFTRLGRIMGAIDSVNAFRGTVDMEASGYDSVGRHVDEIRDEFTTSRSDIVNGMYAARDAYRGVHSSYLNYQKSVAQTTLIEMVNDDTKLASKTVGFALKELIRQMKNTSDTVDANAVAGSSAAASPPTNTGNPAVTITVVDEFGRTLEYSYAETLKLTCTTDVAKGATARRETYSVKGAVAQSDKLSWDWPLGSGANTSIISCDPSENAGTNLLTNSDFEDFTVANTPDNWTIVFGTVGTTIKEDNDEFEGSKALLIVGDGSQLTQITQTIPVASLTPNTVYHYNFWGKTDGSVAAGVLTVDFVDGAGTVIADDNAANNTKTFAITGWTSSYVAKNGTFITPKVLPTTVKIRLRLSTAVTNTEAVYIDELALCEATQLYTAGPYAAVFGGSTNVVAGDAFNLTVTNDRGGALQNMALQLFDPPTLSDVPFAKLLPSDAAAGETIADSLRSAV